MRLGLVITDHIYAMAARDLLQAALSRQWECRCFLTDRGVLLLTEPVFMESPGVIASSVTACELSIDRYEAYGLCTDQVDARVVVGGQYQNAELVKNSDQVIVL